jgi:hypothetical protein
MEMKIAIHVRKIVLLAALLSLQVFGQGSQERESNCLGGVSSKVAHVVSETTSLKIRVRSAHSLGDDLSQEDVMKLCSFLASRPGVAETNLAGLRYLKNEVFTALRNQAVPSDTMVNTLVAIYGDKNQDFVTRDYAVQNLVMCYERPGVSEARQLMHDVLMKAAAEDSSIAGTALLGLHRLQGLGADFSGEEVRRAALVILLEPRTDSMARITAIQVCAERGIHDALPAIENFAQMEGETALRISAISALGRLGGLEQEASLRAWASGPILALRPPALGALKQLTHTMASRDPF